MVVDYLDELFTFMEQELKEKRLKNADVGSSFPYDN